MTFLVGGGFQDSEGNLAANGTLIAQLNAPAVDTSTGTTVVCTNEVKYGLDSAGNVSTDPIQSIWSCDNLQVLPSLAGYIDLYYKVRVYTSRGQLVWGPNCLVLTTANEFDFAVSQYFTGGGAVDFILSNAPVNNSFFFYLNGIHNTNYSLNGINLHLGFTPNVTDTLSVTYYINPSDGSNVAPTFVQEIPAPSASGNPYVLSKVPIANTLALFRNGLFLTLGIDYTLSSNNVTLTTALGTDNLFAIYQTVKQASITYQERPAGIVQPQHFIDAHNIPQTTGMNKVFTLSTSALPGSLQFFLNGVYQTNVLDYALSADGTTVTLAIPPQTGSVIAYYNLNSTAIDIGSYSPSNPA